MRHVSSTHPLTHGRGTKKVVGEGREPSKTMFDFMGNIVMLIHTIVCSSSGSSRWSGGCQGLLESGGLLVGTAVETVLPGPVIHARHTTRCPHVRGRRLAAVGRRRRRRYAPALASSSSSSSTSTSQPMSLKASAMPSLFCRQKKKARVSKQTKGLLLLFVRSASCTRTAVLVLRTCLRA